MGVACPGRGCRARLAGTSPVPTRRPRRPPRQEITGNRNLVIQISDELRLRQIPRLFHRPRPAIYPLVIPTLAQRRPTRLHPVANRVAEGERAQRVRPHVAVGADQEAARWVTAL